MCQGMRVSANMCVLVYACEGVCVCVCMRLCTNAPAQPPCLLELLFPLCFLIPVIAK